MKRTLWITLIAVLGFAIILLARFPATWAAAALPKDVTCAQVAGTVWDGSCAGLVAQGMAVGDVSWELHALRLFSGKLAAYLDITRGEHFVRGDVEASSGSLITASNVQADLPLDRAYIPQLPANLGGHMSAFLQLLRVERGMLTAIQGHVEAHDLVERGAQTTELGSYSVDFPAGDAKSEPVGRLASLSGPLDVQGTLRLTRAPGYIVEGQVAAGPGAAPQLVQQLQYLGTPDAQGKRPFSIEGTF